MIRETFGAQLPPVEESHVGDRFYNTAEDKHYVFDDGEWQAIPETPEPSLPTPTPSDAGKALVVGEDGGFSLGQYHEPVQVTFSDYDVSSMGSGYVTAKASLNSTEIYNLISAGTEVFAIINTTPLGTNQLFRVLFTYVLGDVVYGGSHTGYDTTNHAAVTIHPESSVLDGRTATIYLMD